MAAGHARIDLEEQEVAFAGRQVPFDIDPETARRLLEGLDDIGVTLQVEDAIDAYEAERERPGPGHDAAVTRDWDAATYDRVSGPMVEMAREVLARLDLRGDETVLDAGCGSGRVTRMLLDLVPDGHVIAVDAAPSMVEQARAALPADRVDGAAAHRPRRARASTSRSTWCSRPPSSTTSPTTTPSSRACSTRSGRAAASWRSAAARATSNASAVPPSEVAAGPPFAEHLHGWADPWNFAGAGGDGGAPPPRGLRRRRGLARAAPGGARGPARVPADALPRLPARAPARRAAGRVRGRRRPSTAARRASEWSSTTCA